MSQSRTAVLVRQFEDCLLILDADVRATGTRLTQTALALHGSTVQ